MSEPAGWSPTGGVDGIHYVIAQFALLAIAAVIGVAGPASPVPTGIGVVVLTFGILLAALGAASLGPALTPLPRPAESSTGLRSSGIYAWVRHPIYGGVLLGAMGWALLSSLAVLVVVVLLAVLFVLKARREETWLIARFGEYESYRRQVRRRFVPGLW